MSYRRTRKKTGNTTSRTVTQTTGKGSRITNTTKSSLGGKNTRTYSWSFGKGGKLRRTQTDNINGLITRKTLSASPKTSKVKTTRKSSRRRTSSVGAGALVGGLALFSSWWFWGAIVLMFVAPITIPYVLGAFGIFLALSIVFIILAAWWPFFLLFGFILFYIFK